MFYLKCGRPWAGKLSAVVRLMLLPWLGAALQANAVAKEQTFPLLQIGATTYTNVTVTSKTPTYVFLLHSTGMQSIKVANLPADVRQKLGYVEPEKPKAPTNAASSWAKQTLAKVETPQLKQFEAQFGERWKGYNPKELLPRVRSLAPLVLYGILGGVLLFYLFCCYCAMLICQKAGSPPGLLIWLPVLQKFPLLRAAGMSGWWFLAMFVPVLNLVAEILWCFKIAKARGKSIGVGILLLLPLLNIFAFLYLAFSTGSAPKKEARRVEVMTLETT